MLSALSRLHIRSTPSFFAGPGGDSYSSPHVFKIGGVDHVLLMNEAGVTSVAPADGKPLWEHAWRGGPIVQPALTAEGDVLISVSGKRHPDHAVTLGEDGLIAAARIEVESTFTRRQPLGDD